jgi:uncharacterized protein YndB with AHSA1/START domain
VEPIDPDAPVKARSQIDIATDPRRVWSALADPNAWPTWNPAVHSAVMEADLEVGAPFTFDSGPGPISSRIVAVDAPREIAWRGRSMGFRHHQTWRIESIPGGSRVTTEAAMTGLLSRFLARRLRPSLQADLDAWTHLLKLEAEMRAAHASEPAAVLPESMVMPDASPRDPRGGKQR